MLLEVLVLLADVAEVDVVRPAVANAVADGVGGALKRRDGGGGPHADEAHAAAVGLAGIGGSAHLHRQRDGLRQQDGDEE